MKKLIVGLFAAVSVFAFATVVKADKPSDSGFDDAGYNDQANIFNGTGLSWCMDKLNYTVAQCEGYLGAYTYDKLIMKWNNEWVRGNEENWSNPPYKAWENNEWNGNTENGSGAVWHYKIVWVGDYKADPTLIPDGAYGLWNQFAVIMDQGTDPNYGPGHFWFAHAMPAGYGAY